MPKEWILNSVMNRFQLNYKRNVGATSEAIRKCAPRSLSEWESYYFAKVRSRKHIKQLGRKLYVKISEVVHAEISEITEQDCIDYMVNLVINRTYDGYQTEIQTVYGQLQNLLKRKIEPAPDDWDRRFNVDFYIEIKGKYIGLQIKPIPTGLQLAQVFKEYSVQKKTHEKFTEKYGGRVFYVFSEKINGKKQIKNIEVLKEIQNEIETLGK